MMSPSNKAIGRYLAGLLLVLLVAGGLLLAWLGKDSALQWGARQAEQRSDGQLALGAVHGSLYGPLRIERLSFQNDEIRIELKQLELDWSLVKLFNKHLQVDRLSLVELRITEIRASAQAAELPESLKLPLSLSIPAITLGQLVFKRGGDEYVLRDVALSVDKTAESYQLSLHNVDSQWGRGEAELKLGEQRPFPVTARLGLKQAKGLGYQAEVDASGDLTQMELKATLQALDGQAHANALVTPFATFPLKRADIKAEGVNPAIFDKALPAASLGAEIVLESGGGDRVLGSVKIVNLLSGRVDQSRLPLRELSARFAGTPERLDLSAMRLDLGTAGQFSGEGQVNGSQLYLKLATTDFDPAGVHHQLRGLRLAGDLQLQADPKVQSVLTDLRDKRFRFKLDASHVDSVLELRQLSAQAGSGSVSLKGALTLAGRQPFQVTGLLRGFNPADFGDYPAAGVNASFSSSGHLATEPEANLEFAIADSHFRQLPLSGQGMLSASTTRFWNADLLLRLARNRLEAKGALGAAGDRLDFKMDADDLAQLDPELGGKGRASGTVEGRFADPSGNIDATFSELSWRKQYQAESVQLRAQLENGADGRVDLDASLRNLVASKIKLDQASLRAEGSRIRHTLQLATKNSKLDLSARLVGGWRDDSGWTGQIVELNNRGPHPLALAEPAKLEIGNQRVRLGGARFAIAKARFTVHELAYKAGEILSRGDFQGLRATWLSDLAGMNDEFKTDLTLAGDWKIVIRDNVNGHAALRREQGDVRITGLAQAALGLDRLGVNLEAVNNKLQGRVEATGSRLGKLQAEATSTLSARNGVWGLAGDAPIQGRAELAIESLAWLQPFLGIGVGFDGALNAGLRLDGTLAQPQLAGRVSGDRFNLALPDLGLSLSQGSFRAELRDQALHLDELTIQGGDGRLSGQGRLALEGGSPVMQLELKADKLEVLSRPDRHLILSGTSDASFAADRLLVAAKLRADRGLIELPRGDAPTLSDDVVVLGRASGKERKGLPFAMQMALDIDLGESFVVKGKGLDAQLGGALHVSSEGSGVPSARGSVRVVKGAYSAYGQRLEIERGILNFQGPIDNPGLNIVALRKNQPVEAGVAVTGTAQSPSVRLVSNPGVADSEKLSWLVLGHGFEGSSDKEFGALQAAAGALLAAGDSVSLQQRIAHGTGLEEVSLKGGGGLESAVLSLGKRLSSRAYLSFEQGLAGATSLVKVNYTLTERISVRAQAGTTPAVDLFYTYGFD